ncbi:MAG: acyl-CoA dehydrogenase family protein [Deltaproteobacteria bacterium]|nr:acyl-CoA dehydrogenase family protein [Deltaproteobacteria bacterium]
MRRTIFDDDHELFREQVRRFVEAEVAPRVAEWNAAGTSDRETWRKAGAAGLLGAGAPEEYGGSGGTFLHDAIVIEEFARARGHAMMMSLHSDICLPYLLHYGTPEQKERWAPGAIRGEVLLGIAMTEPEAGSDLQAIQTRAVRDGDDYVINGSKTFISNGQIGDLFIVVVKTDPDARPGRKGMSLVLVPADTPGFVRGRKLDKLGLRGQDTSELFFEDCRVPVEYLLGDEGRGFYMLMEQLQQERLSIAVGAMASCRRALEDTLAYVKERRAFGQPIAAFQNTQFKLAELATEVELGQVFVDQLTAAHVRGDDVVTEVSMAKWWTTDLQKRLTAECLQLHGGYGFMREYPISEDYADAAVQSIYAGTNEIMKVIIARRLGLDAD